VLTYKLTDIICHEFPSACCLHSRNRDSRTAKKTRTKKKLMLTLKNEPFL